MNLESVQIVRVQHGARRRKLDRAKAKRLAASIAEIGLLNPITVCVAGDEYQLVAGRHRLEACKLLGWDKVPAVVVGLSHLDRALAEIDENLVRNDLTDLERAEHLATRKRLYLLKHPETANPNVRGGPGRGNKTTEISSAVSFAQDAAEKIGVTDRSIRQDVQIAESIPEDVREALRETPLADSKTDLLDIARLPEAAQRDVIARADLSDKASIRAQIASHRPARPGADKSPVEEVHTTEVRTTVEGFALAVASLFSVAERRRLIQRITDDINTEARQSR